MNEPVQIEAGGKRWRFMIPETEPRIGMKEQECVNRLFHQHAKLDGPGLPVR